MIKIENLSKKYGKKKLALNNINLEFSKGKVVGILGPNGSGKTTLLKLLQGYLKPTTGSIKIFGEEIGPETKKRVSYLPDVQFIPKDYLISEAKNAFKTFFNDFNEVKFEELLKFMELEEDMKVGDLSKGMSEKLHLSLILSRDADIFIIDEPIAGVDIVARDKILEAIFSNIGENKLLLLTTHLIDELENLFEEVYFISNGEIILSGNADEIRNEKNKSITDVYREVFGNIQ